MKGLWAIILLALLVWGYIYYRNNQNTPIGGLIAPDPAPEDTYEPLILDSKNETGILSISAHAAEAETNLKASTDAVQEPQKPAILPEQPRMMGKEDAPITLYLFSSLTCSHCVHYHLETLPELEKKYIDAGKVKLVYIDFPFDRRALAGAMLTRCARPESYWKFLNVLFENQDKWAFKENAQDVVTTYASLAGMSKADIQSCLANKILQQSLIQNRDVFMKKYDIQGTPTTVLVKGDQVKTVVGTDLKSLEDAINALQ